MKSLLVVGLLMSALTAPAAASVPPWFPTRLTHLADARQAVVVAGDSRTSSHATLYAYQRGAGGKWVAAFPAKAARVGYAGWHWAARRVEGDGSTPAGTFRITTAFGLAADPGAKIPYRRVDGNDYWVGDARDPRTYNLFQPAATARRTWRIGTAERLAAYPRQYAYAAVIDFNRPSVASVTWNPTLGEYVTRAPVAARGSAVFLHVNGAGSTAGCVSLARSDLVAVLRWLDPAQNPRIVQASIADLGRA